MSVVSQYVSKYAVCPFYHRNDDNRICCEGTDERNTINIVFEGKNQLKEYSVIHCNSIEGCKSCLIYKALDTKY